MNTDKHLSHGDTSFREEAMRFLPVTRREMEWRGWDALDVLLISGDAYVDHPSFGVPLLGRWLEKLGYRVGIIPQPRWDNTDDIARMGTPRLFVGVSSGTVDSMINNYTANRRKRSDDQYSEGGQGGKRPDYAATVYTQLARKAFPESVIIAGGVEASLRRLAHYDYWQNKVRPSFLLTADADLLAFGMGEKSVSAIAQELDTAAKVANGPALRTHEATQRALENLRSQRGLAYLTTKAHARELEPRLTLPAFEEVRGDKAKFAKTAFFIEQEASPYNGKLLVQYHGSKAVVVNPPPLPLATAEFDAIYELPFTKEPHPMYRQKIPAAEMIKFSITATRGCFGGCTFCAITLHQGRVLQSRSEHSILNEINRLKDVPGYTGQITDVGGPTANMYGMRCESHAVQSVCRKFSCVHPKVCPHLVHDHALQVRLLEKARHLPGVKKIGLGSGVRYDIALADERSGRKYLRDLIAHHVGGHLKVAPEHTDPEVLRLMKKPPIESFEEFLEIFERTSREVKKEQYVVPYFISGFPGSTHEKMVQVQEYLKSRRWNLQQVQAFIPTPMTLATAMYWTGLDPATREPLFVAKGAMDRKIQQALLQPHREKSREVLHKFRTAPRRPHNR
ncbi:MAG: YgiQ family radical SAM protein [Nitrospinae bacterium]|nr:YgiQ family radical SAM protein [Nitrospinota bacterium]